MVVEYIVFSIINDRRYVMCACEKEPHVRITERRTVREGNGNEIGITGLSSDEFNKTMRMFAGLEWVGVEGGRLVSHPRVKPLPGPGDDEAMLPFWRAFKPQAARGEGIQLEPKVFEDKDFKNTSPSIVIQHLCGYDYTPENYRKQAALLESWGFSCLRSRRGEDGRYWEAWFLPGLFFAEGDLKEAIRDKDDVEGALGFIRLNASFGTLDVTVQRLCAILDPD